MSERIRTTISLDPEVHAIFVTMAEAAGTSVSRCMGDWLADTAEGAQFVSMKMQEARRAPKTVMREMQAMAVGLHEEITSQIGRRGQGGGTRTHAGASGDLAASSPPSPPSSNTGGKVPRENPSARGRKGS